jgi:gluconate kinase
MKLLVLFGLPGAGKTFTGKILQKDFGFFLYNGDLDMADAYKKAVREERMTDELRQEFFDHLIESIGKLEYEKIVVTQTFIKEKFRKQFLNAYPYAKFILIETHVDIREKRIMNGGRFKLSLEKWRRMSKLFDPPGITHEVVCNNEEGEEAIKKQLGKLLG